MTTGRPPVGPRRTVRLRPDQWEAIAQRAASEGRDQTATLRSLVDLALTGQQPASGLGDTARAAYQLIDPMRAEVDQLTARLAGAHRWGEAATAKLEEQAARLAELEDRLEAAEAAPYWPNAELGAPPPPDTSEQLRQLLARCLPHLPSNRLRAEVASEVTNQGA
jgi:hypothetical protein